MFFSGDVAYLLHVTNQMLAGGHYGQDIFETNPPMILYLYSPVSLLAKFSSINIMTVMRVYILFLASTSVFCSFLLLKKIFKQQDNLLMYALYYALLFTVFILPADQFGQREHFFLIFFLPYFFSTALALAHYRLPFLVKLMIGIFAGLGIALKPYFLAPFILIELYVLFANKSLFDWARVETITVLSVLIIYLSAVFLLQPGYIKILLPLISEFYFIGIEQPLIILLLNNITVFSVIITSLYIIFQKEDPYRYLSTVLLLGMFGMMLAYIFSRTYWYYHILPALALSVLLFTYYISVLIKKNHTAAGNTFKLCRYNWILVFIAAVFAFLPLIYTVDRYMYFLNEDNNRQRNQLINYINQLPHTKTISCFSVNTTRDCFPLVYAIHKTYASRFPFLWWLRGVLKLEAYPKQIKLSPQARDDKAYLIEKIAAELDQFNIDLILINTQDLKEVIDDKFNLISYLSQNKKFLAAWQHYKYLTSINDYQIYQRKKKE